MKTKILFLIADLGGGGAEKVLVNLVNALPQEKYDITVRTIFGKGINAQFLAPHVRYSSLLPCRMIGGYVLLSKLLSRRWLYKLLVRDDYDIEIAYMMHLPTRALGGSNSSARKYAWSHIKHISRHAYRNAEEFYDTYRGLDGIAFVSENGLDDFNKRYFQHPYGRVVHNVVDSEFIKASSKEPIQINLDNKTINICSVGRLCEQKGYLRLVSTLARISRMGITNWHLYLLGEGNDKDKILTKASSMGISDKITLLGFDTNPFKYVAKMDLFVCSSYTEGYSTAVTESIIVGTPVLTTDCSGMDEIIGGTDAGEIVENSEEGLTEGIKRLLSNPQRIEEMRDAAKERSNAFSTEATVKEFEDFINGVK